MNNKKNLLFLHFKAFQTPFFLFSKNLQFQSDNYLLYLIKKNSITKCSYLCVGAEGGCGGLEGDCVREKAERGSVRVQAEGRGTLVQEWG